MAIKIDLDKLHRITHSTGKFIDIPLSMSERAILIDFVQGYLRYFCYSNEQISEIENLNNTQIINEFAYYRAEVDKDLARAFPRFISYNA